MGTEVAKPLDEFRGTVDKLGAQFAMALPQHISVEKFQRIVMNAVSNNQDLLTADRRTLLGACMQAAGDGLLLDNREAALVIFKTKQGESWIQKVQYMPMIGGIMKKVRNSGEVLSITTGIVHENDEFRHFTDPDGEHFHHEPNYGSDRGGERLAYAVVRTKDDGVYIEVMDRQAVEKVRAVSKSKDGPAWNNWWGEMARKTVFRRLSKRLPISSDLQTFIEQDDNLTDLSQTPQERATGTTIPSRPTRLAGLSAPRSEAPAHDQATGEVLPAGEAPVAAADEAGTF